MLSSEDRSKHRLRQLLTHPVFKRYFAESLLIDKWKWDACTYSMVEDDFQQVATEFESIWEDPDVQGCIAEIPTAYEDSPYRELRKNIRKTAIVKIIYQLNGVEIFRESDDGINNHWKVVDSAGNDFKIGKVISRSPGSSSPSNLRKSYELIKNRSTVEFLEPRIYPGIAQDTIDSISEYENSLMIGEQIKEFERTNKVPCFMEEIYIQHGAKGLDNNSGIRLRIAEKDLLDCNLQTEELMAIGIYPYCSALIKRLIDEHTDLIDHIIENTQLPQKDQVLTLKAKIMSA